MLYILSSFSSLGYCLALKRFLRWPIATTPFFIVSFTIILFYVAAYCNLLSQISLGFLSLGWLSLLSAYFYLPRDRNTLLNDYFTPGLFLLILLLTIYGLLSCQRVVSGTDDILRYLPHAKLIYLHHGLWLNTDTVADKDYPPGAALFYYLIMQLSHFSEGALFFAQLFLTFSPLLLLVSKYRWRDWPLVFIVFVFIIIFYDMKLGARSTLYLDNITGLFFGGALASYYIMRKMSYQILYLIFPLSALVLFKPMLLPFSLTVAMVIFCDQLYLAYFTKTPDAILARQKILSYSLLFIAPIAIAISWQHYVRHDLQIQPILTLVGLWQAIESHKMVLTPNQFQYIWPHYLRALIEPTILMVTIGLINVWRTSLVPKDSKVTAQTQHRIWLSYFMMSSAYIIYIVSLLIVYFFQMPAGIVMEMNSFSRFITIYNVGWTLIILAQLIYLSDKPLLSFSAPILKKMQYGIAAIFLIAMSLNAALATFRHSVDFDAKNSPEYLRYMVQQQITGPLLQMIPGDARVGVFLNQWIPLPQIIGYELLPKQNYPLLGYSNQYSPSDQYFKKYDYIIVASNDHSSLLPSTTIVICANKNLTGLNQRDCQLHTVPIYVYKLSPEQNPQLLSLSSNSGSLGKNKILTDAEVNHSNDSSRNQ